MAIHAPVWRPRPTLVGTDYTSEAVYAERVAAWLAQMPAGVRPQTYERELGRLAESLEREEQGSADKRDARPRGRSRRGGAPSVVTIFWRDIPAQVIVGKFVAVFIFYLALWAPTLIYVLMVKSQAAIDWGAVASSYLGVALFGAVFVSLGLFASTLARNQIIAAVIAFTGLIMLFGLPLMRGLLISSSGFGAVIDHADLWRQMADYAKGIVDTRYVVYELSLTGLFLFLSTKSLELGKWR